MQIWNRSGLYRGRYRSLHATHPLILMMICAKYGKNASRIVDFFQGESRKLEKIAKIWNLIILLSTWHLTHLLMVVIICGNYGKNRSRAENVTERTRFSKSRLTDIEDIGLGQRSSYATHLMPVIICTKYGKNPSRTVDGTEWTRFSRPRPNDLEDIGQDQRSLYATHPLMLVIICATYGKNPSTTVDFCSRSRPKFF